MSLSQAALAYLDVEKDLEACVGRWIAKLNAAGATDQLGRMGLFETMRDAIFWEINTHVAEEIEAAGDSSPKQIEAER